MTAGLNLLDAQEEDIETALGGKETVEEFRSVVDQYLQQSNSLSDMNLRNHCLAYLISASFKDCSILVRIAINEETGQISQKIKAIDVDPKQFKKLGHYARLDKEIREFAESYAANMTPCQSSFRHLLGIQLRFYHFRLSSPIVVSVAWIAKGLYPTEGEEVSSTSALSFRITSHRYMHVQMIYCP